MKILITGGAGFIGSHIADILIENNHHIIIIDNISTGKIENINKKAVFYQEDLSNFNRIEELIKKEKPEIIYHLAAQVDIRKSIANPIEDAKTNILNTLNLLELSVKNNIKHFIFSSTGGAIYGDTEIPTNESENESPISPYGCAKLAIEKYLHYYNQVHKLKYTCLRYSNVYGPRQNSKSEAGVISIFLDNMFSNNNPKIFGGTQTRDFVFVKDIARANLLVLNERESNIYNVGTGIETDIIQIFSFLNKYFNNKFTPEFLEMKKGEQKRSCLSYAKIKKHLNWIPLTSIEEGLDKTYIWSLKSNK